MPGMDGYLQKQVGRLESATPAMLAKWDRRYFVVPAGRTTLRYYRTQADYMSRKEPSGTIDVAGACLKVERNPAAHVVHVVSGARARPRRHHPCHPLTHTSAGTTCHPQPTSPSALAPP